MFETTILNSNWSICLLRRGCALSISTLEDCHALNALKSQLIEYQFCDAITHKPVSIDDHLNTSQSLYSAAFNAEQLPLELQKYVVTFTSALLPPHEKYRAITMFDGIKIQAMSRKDCEPLILKFKAHVLGNIIYANMQRESSRLTDLWRCISLLIEQLPDDHEQKPKTTIELLVQLQELYTLENGDYNLAINLCNNSITFLNQKTYNTNKFTALKYSINYFSDACTVLSEEDDDYTATSPRSRLPYLSYTEPSLAQPPRQRLKQGPQQPTPLQNPKTISLPTLPPLFQQRNTM